MISAHVAEQVASNMRDLLEATIYLGPNTPVGVADLVLLPEVLL